jgi:hypothetical protein
MSADQLESGYRWAYREFYRWTSIVRGACAHEDRVAGLRHLAYAAGWKKFEPLWDLVIRARRTAALLPVLETILSDFGRRSPGVHVCSRRPIPDYDTPRHGGTEKPLKSTSVSRCLGVS